MVYLSRIVVHQSSFSEDEVVFNPKHFPALRVGDLVQITKVKDSGTASSATPAPAAGGAAASHTSPPATPAHTAAASLTSAQPVSDGRGEGREGGRSATSLLSSPLSSAASPLCVRVVRLGPVKGNIECSLLSSLAALFDLSARDEVLVRSVTADSVAVSSLELSFERAFIGRSDHWRIRSALQQQTVHMGKAIVVEGMKLRLDEMSRVDDELGGLVRCSSGLVTSSTRLTFRSRSARLLFFVQMSYEMWEHADDGEVHFEKTVGFFRNLLMQWRSLKVNHSVSIVLFSRTIASPAAAAGEDGGGGGAVGGRAEVGAAAASPPPYDPAPVLYSMDGSGRLYVDRYEVVVEGETPDEDDGGVWGDRLLVNLKAAFHRYQQHMQWGTTATIEPQHIRYTHLDGMPAKERLAPSSALPVTLSASSAVSGNVLEAINCAVSIFDQHYVDRDLYRTGQNIVLCSAGRGLFLVSHDLAQLTKQRMVDAGIGCDLICMTRPPLHAAPLFVYDRQMLEDPFGFLFPAAQPQHTTQPTASRLDQPREPRPPLTRSASTQSVSPPTPSHPSSLGTVPPFLRQYTEPSNVSSSSPSTPYYIPHWISVFFYDYQDLYDTPFGTIRNQVTTAAAVEQHVDAKAGEDEDEGSDREEDGDEEREEELAVRVGKERVDVDSFHPRRLRRRESSLSAPPPSPSTALSSPAVTSLAFAGPSVGLSCCRLYDFRPTEPAALTAWLLDSAAPTSTSAWGFASSTLPPSAFSATFAPPHTAARATATSASSLPESAFAQSCAAYDEGVFGFRAEQPPHEGEELKEEQLSLTLSSSFPYPSPVHSPPPLLARGLTGAVPVVSPSTSSSSSSSLSARCAFPSFSPAVSWSLTFARRWAHLHTLGDESGSSLFHPNWKSLCKPAMLPLTTSFLQPLEELHSPLYVQYNYACTLSEQHDNEALLEEIICQRQAKDYQYIITTPTQQHHAHISSASHSPHSPATLSSVAPLHSAQASVRMLSPSAADTRSSPSRSLPSPLASIFRVASPPSSSPLSPPFSLLPPTSAPAPPLPPPRFNLALAAARRRAAHGKLHCEAETDKGSAVSPSSPFPSSSPSIAPPSFSSSASSPSASRPSSPLVYYFSLRHQVHALSYDPARSTISVTRYVLKREVDAAARLLRVPYHYYLYSPLTGSFLSCDRLIEPNRDDLDWNYADQKLAGQHDDYEDKLKYRRVRFALLPPRDALDSRDAHHTAAMCRQRVAAMDALWVAVLKKSMAQMDVAVAKPLRRQRRSRPSSPSSSSPQASGSPVPQPRTLPRRAGRRSSASMQPMQSLLAKPGIATTRSPPRASSPQPSSAVAPPVSLTETAQLTSPSTTSWSSTAVPIARAEGEGDGESRETEEEEDWDFDLTEPSAAPASANSSAAGPRSASDIDDVLRSDVGFAVRVFPLNTIQVKLPRSETHSSLMMPASTTAPPPTPPPPASASSSSSSSTTSASSSTSSTPDASPSPFGARLLPRDEWFFLQYESSYHPLSCYHVEVHWLTATGVHIEQWCRQLQKRAERLGIAMVKIPAHQRIHTADAFHQPIHIHLTLHTQQRQQAAGVEEEERLARRIRAAHAFLVHKVDLTQHRLCTRRSGCLRRLTRTTLLTVAATFCTPSRYCSATSCSTERIAGHSSSPLVGPGSRATLRRLLPLHLQPAPRV